MNIEKETQHQAMWPIYLSTWHNRPDELKGSKAFVFESSEAILGNDPYMEVDDTSETDRVGIYTYLFKGPDPYIHYGGVSDGYKELYVTPDVWTSLTNAMSNAAKKGGEA